MGIPQTVYEREAELRNSQLFKAKSKRDFENPYLEALRMAKADEESHFQKQEAATKAFFARHPENLHELFVSEKKIALFLPWQEGKRRFVYEPITLRGENRVDVEMRFGVGWFGRVVDDAWIGLPQQRGEKKDWRWEIPAEENYWQDDKMIQLELPMKYEVA
jgi:hypothetical protein